MPYVIDIPFGLAGGGSGPIRQLARYYHADGRWDYYPSYGPYGNDWARLSYFGQVDYTPVEILDMLPFGVASTVTPIVAEIVSQTPEPTIPSDTDVFAERVPEKSGIPNYEGRKRRGEILVHPYYRYKITFNRIAAIATVTGHAVSPKTVPCNSDYMLAELRPYAKLTELNWDKDRVTPYSSNPWSYMSENPGYSTDYVRSYGSIAYQRINVSYVRTDSPTFGDSVIMKNKILSDVNNYPQDTALVTDVLAKANQGDWDILTSLMELNDTVRYIALNLQRVQSIILAFKKRQLNLLSGLKDVESRPRPRYDKERAKYRNVVDRDFDFREYRKELKQWKKDQRLDRLSILDSLASLRLEFEYALKPLFAEFRAIKKALSKVGYLYQTKKGYSRRTYEYRSFTLTGGHYTGQIRVQIEDRCWLKRSYSDNSFIEGLLQRCLISIPVTALELTPVLGIVVNWFCNLGDWLAAWNLDSTYDTEVCTYSRKATISGSLRRKDKGTISIPASRVYKLDVINPREVLACQLSNNMTLSRTLNAFALSWVALRASVTNVPINNVR